MPTIPIYHVNAFTDKLFSGNPAAICWLEETLTDNTLQKIAAENNLPTTAFVVQRRDINAFDIRWFTPEYELDLCGHGTLAAAYVIFNFIRSNLSEINFFSKIDVLKVQRDQDWIRLHFPIKMPEKITPDPILIEGLGITPEATYQYQTERCLVVLKNENLVKQLKPNLTVLRNFSHRGIVITAKSNQKPFDFLSRTFYPKKNLNPEDAVTGASHCLLVPYWAEQLNKTILNAYQASSRGGFLKCTLNPTDITLSGQAVLYLKGQITVF